MQTSSPAPFTTPAIYFVADPAACAGRDVVDVVKAAIRGGIHVVQYRDKSSDLSAIQQGAARLYDAVKEEATRHGKTIPFFVNDYIQIAKTIGADGVHLGQGDGDVLAARDILGNNVLIGWTAYTPAHFHALNDFPPGTVDYVGTGPVYPTSVKKDKTALGPQGLAELIKLSTVPVIGIGGITPDNALPVLQADAAGVAMMNSISAADNPEQAAKDFQNVLSKLS